VNIFARIRFSTLGRRDIPASTTTEAIGWWETRRIPFNLIVGTGGILTCIIIGIVGLGSWIFWGSVIGMPNSPLLALLGVVLYGFAANVCYTGGWLTELVIRKLWPREADRFATLTFSTGLIFSVVLTLAPGMLVAAGAVYELAVRLRATHP
jgi:hypothetical protein